MEEAVEVLQERVQATMALQGGFLEAVRQRGASMSESGKGEEQQAVKKQ